MKTARSTLHVVIGYAALVAVMAGAPGAAAAAEQPAFDTGPAAAALRRLVPDHHQQVTLRAAPSTDGDRFRVSGGPGQITVEGTSPAVLLTGFNWYLKHVAHADISWNGEQLRLPDQLPGVAGDVTRSADVPHRFALNDTNDGYTGPYRDWADWEREIDVLALHGVNEVLVYTGQDAVYHRTFREFGYADSEIRSWIPAPAHQPWWLLQNMSGFGGPVSRALLDKRVALAKKIVDRLRELGMTPVFPGYFGTVPPGFADRNPGARVVPQGEWGGFQRPDWLDPRNPYFSRVAEAFYRHQSELYGDSTMYKMDLLHEGGRPGDVPVGEAAKAVEHALRKAHPGAIWNILGWQSNPRKEILDAVDKSKMFIVDGLSDRFGWITDREADWQGTPYAFGSIWNFGGHTTLGANAPDWVSLYTRWRDKPNSALSGIAMMPEAADNNPAAMDLFTELAWTSERIDLDEWFTQYARARYGGADPHAEAAWQALRETAYGTTRADSWSEGQDGLFGARPSLAVRSAAAWSPQRLRYDSARFDRALTELLLVDPRLRDSSAYRYDVVDVARQAMSNRSRLLLPQIKAAYDARDRQRFEELTGLWLRWIRLLDDVVASNDQHLLGAWLADARSWGADEAERDQLEYDARSLITVWGDRKSSDEGLHDYANREWAGLLGDFYHRRWKTYFDELGAALAEGRSPRSIDWFALEDGWAREQSRYPARAAGDSYDLARQVARELARDPHQVELTASADQGAVSADDPVTVTAAFTNRNGFAAAHDVSLSLRAPEGMTAEPLTATGDDSVGPGETFTARWRVRLTGTADRLVSALRVTSEHTVAGNQATASAAARVMTATGVREPYRTVSFNGARFGQAGESFAIEGGGADLWGGTNEFGAAYLDDALAGAATVTTKVVAQDHTGNWARAGIIVRNDLTANGSAGYLNLAVTPANGCVLSWDADGDGRLDSIRQNTSFSAPVHLRLTRTSGGYTGECSVDGVAWESVGSANPAAVADRQDVGLFMTAANGWTGGRGIAEFEGLALRAG